MKNWVLAGLLALIAVAPVLYLAPFSKSKQRSSDLPAVALVQFQEERPMALEPGAVFDVHACKVIDGYMFELCLSGGVWIEAHLTAATTDEAVKVVVDLFNNALPPPPTVTLKRKVGNYWIVDFDLTIEGRRVSLEAWLRNKGLLL